MMKKKGIVDCSFMHLKFPSTFLVPPQTHLSKRLTAAKSWLFACLSAILNFDELLWMLTQKMHEPQYEKQTKKTIDALLHI